MAKKPPEPGSVDRRSFLAGAATGAAVMLAKQASVAAAQEAAPTPARAEPSVQAGKATGRPASDYMVDVFKSLGMEYMFSMCASSFMGLHESILNYAGNKNPQAIACTHEEISVAMANGYAKIDGKPVLVCAHSTVGAQHATMALFDAYADRVPVYIVLGNTNDAANRDGEVFWVHSAQDPCALVRDITKWDDNPASITHFAESAARAYKIAMTPPMGPVALVVDDHMQDEQVPVDLRVPRVAVPTPPAGDSGRRGRGREAARRGRESRDHRGPRRAHARGARAHGRARGDAAGGRRRRGPPLEFPDAPSARAAARRPRPTSCSRSSTATSRMSRARRGSATRRCISISSTHLFQRSNYQDVMRYAEVDMAVAADAEATLPALIEEIKRQTTAARREAFRQRGAKVAEANRRHIRARADRCHLRLGREPRQHRAACRWSSGRSSRTRTGRT